MYVTRDTHIEGLSHLAMMICSSIVSISLYLSLQKKERIYKRFMKNQLYKIIPFT